METTKQQNTTKFILTVIKPFKWLIAGQLIVSLIWAVDLSLRPYIVKTMLDSMVNLNPSHAAAVLTPLALCYVGMSTLVVIAYRCYDYFWLKLNPPLKKHIGLILMQRMMGHSHSLYQIHFAGSLGNKIKDVMSGIPDIIRIIVDQFVSNILAISIAMLALTQVNMNFAIGLFIWVSCFIFGTLKFSIRAQKLSDAAAEVRSTTVGTIVDILNNMMSVRLFAGINAEKQKLTETLDNYVKADQTRDWFFMKMFSFQGASFIIYQSFCLTWLIIDFKHNLVTPGDFVLVLTINLSIIENLWSLSRDANKFTEIAGNITNGLRIVLTPYDIQDTEDAKSLVVTQGEIAFHAVEFNYQKETQALFHNKSVIISPGEKVGLVGYSGSGKSTFVNLILRVFDVTAGSITIDQQNIANITQSSLHASIAMIPQEPSLFHRSLMDNIRYGKPNASDDEVFAAAKQANAHDFIQSLPAGYNSLAGERGVKLSGGQRQRIAIARAILKNAPILILDEATSQLDSITESEIQTSLWQLMQNKTTIVIAHRLSTLLHMDRILVFSDGKIIEEGTHKSLIDNGSLYRTLWETQISGLLPEKKVRKKKERKNLDLVSQ